MQPGRRRQGQPVNRLYAVVLAGGRGSRFWPLSNPGQPKPFLPLCEDGTSMVSRTWQRLEGIVGAERVFVVADSKHSELIGSQLPDLPAGRFVEEEGERGTAAAVCLAAERICREDPGALLLVCPSDHQISPDGEFSRTVEFAVNCLEALEGEEDPVTLILGVEASSPLTCYGYLSCGEVVESSDGLQCSRVSAFKEKPDPASAAAFLDSGAALWSTGIFLWRAGDYLRLFEKYVGGSGSAPGEPVSVDEGILEKTSNVFSVRASFSWLDVGTWDRYALELEEAGSGNRVRGNFVSLDTKDCIVVSGRRMIAAVGVKDLVIVETENSVLVCHRDSAERVRDLVQEMDNRRDAADS